MGFLGTFWCTHLACPVAGAVPDVTSVCAQEQILTHPGGGSPILVVVDLELVFSSRLRLSLLPAGKVSNSPSLADLRITCVPIFAHWPARRADGHHLACLQDALIGCAEQDVAAILGLA